MQRFNDFPVAFDLGREAVSIAPTNALAFRQLAGAAAMTNRHQEALQACAQAIKLAPDDPMLRVLMGSLEADAGQYDKALAQLGTSLSQGLPVREAFRAHKELARVLDKLGRFDEVFGHLHESARLAPALPEYSNQPAAQLLGMIQANRKGFDRALTARWAAASFLPDAPAPVFLIGFFRSGTTLTQEVLDAHPDVFVADEIGFISAIQRQLHQIDPTPQDTASKLRKLDAQGIARLRSAYWRRVHDHFGDSLGGRMLVDKFTMNTIDIGLINTIFPDAKVIFVVRDPRDVCLSCFMQLMVPSAATAHLLSWRGTAAFYSCVLDWWTHVSPLMTAQCIQFRYEDAIADFEGTFRGVFRFLGLPWDPAVASFHRHTAGKYVSSPSRAQVAQPLYSSSVARWRHYAPEFEPVADQLRPWIAALGYDQH
ncbi:sulfotransferase [Accumulibacter sp.]|uniref:tetratricopeptide repeat-containing sulfotransferase family protein n=1 Tax=Accumulibacter sp. TaxID=2053492 RepID=UPI003417E2BE